MQPKISHLAEATVAIVGLGLIGGSLALALGEKCGRRIGVARRQETANLAVHIRAVDGATTHLRPAVEQADIVVLAAPVQTILSMVEEVGAYMRPGSLLTDVGSTKGAIVTAMGRLPEHLTSVGGHPMCGKEVGGLGHADASIFKGATYVLTPTLRTTDEAMSLCSEMVEAIGPRPLVLDAERHDRAAAYVSHLPYLLAASLVQAEAEAELDDPVVGKLASSGFRDTTRLAASEVPMMLDILLSNRQAIEEALAGFERHVVHVRKLLDDPNGLEEWMERSQRKRRGMFV
jgi:prephenate dehydrogenase